MPKVTIAPLAAARPASAQSFEKRAPSAKTWMATFFAVKVPAGTETLSAGEAREARFLRHPPAQLLACLGQMHAIAALAQRPGAFEARGAGTDDEHRIFRALGRNDLGMPALAPLLAHGGVLGAADRGDGVVAADADAAGQQPLGALEQEIGAGHRIRTA